MPTNHLPSLLLPPETYVASMSLDHVHLQHLRTSTDTHAVICFRGLTYRGESLLKSSKKSKQYKLHEKTGYQRQLLPLRREHYTILETVLKNYEILISILKTLLFTLQTSSNVQTTLYPAGVRGFDSPLPPHFFRLVKTQQI